MRVSTVVLIGLLASGGTAFAANTAAGTAHTTNGHQTFVTEAAAAKSCGASNVVWANTRSRAYHVAGSKFFGHTKHGAWMCMGTAKAEGFHQAGTKAAAG